MPSSDGAHESAIQVDQSQPGALKMVIGGQHEHLVAVHCDVSVNVEEGTITGRGFSGLNRGDDLQV